GARMGSRVGPVRGARRAGLPLLRPERQRAGAARQRPTRRPGPRVGCARYARASMARYRMQHWLPRTVAYEALLRKDREGMHRAAALAIEASVFATLEGGPGSGRPAQT